jgi:hypothetical protein
VLFEVCSLRFGGPKLGVGPKLKHTINLYAMLIFSARLPSREFLYDDEKLIDVQRIPEREEPVIETNRTESFGTDIPEYRPIPPLQDYLRQRTLIDDILKYVAPSNDSLLCTPDAFEKIMVDSVPLTFPELYIYPETDDFSILLAISDFSYAWEYQYVPYAKHIYKNTWRPYEFGHKARFSLTSSEYRPETSSERELMIGTSDDIIPESPTFTSLDDYLDDEDFVDDMPTRSWLRFQFDALFRQGGDKRIQYSGYLQQHVELPTDIFYPLHLPDEFLLEDSLGLPSHLKWFSLSPPDQSPSRPAVSVDLSFSGEGLEFNNDCRFSDKGTDVIELVLNLGLYHGQPCLCMNEGEPEIWTRLRNMRLELLALQPQTVLPFIFLPESVHDTSLKLKSIESASRLCFRLHEGFKNFHQKHKDFLCSLRSASATVGFVLGLDAAFESSNNHMKNLSLACKYFYSNVVLERVSPDMQVLDNDSFEEAPCDASCQTLVMELGEEIEIETTRVSYSNLDSSASAQFVPLNLRLNAGYDTSLSEAKCCPVDLPVVPQDPQALVDLYLMLHSNLQTSESHHTPSLVHIPNINPINAVVVNTLSTRPVVSPIASVVLPNLVDVSEYRKLKASIGNASESRLEMLIGQTVLISEELMVNLPELVIRLKNAYGITCIDCPLQYPIQLIVDEITGVTVIAAEILLDNVELKSFLKQLVNISFKFRCLWIIFVVRETHIPPEAILKFQQSIKQFPLVVSIRMISINSLCDQIFSTCVESAITATSEFEVLLSDYTARTYLNLFNNRLSACRCKQF